MKNSEGYESDLAAIRSTMERSAKFMSLSGLSGVLAGLYALAGVAYAYFVFYFPTPPFSLSINVGTEKENIFQLAIIAALVLVMSLGTALLLSARKARKANANIWNKPSKLLLLNLSVPLITGGLLVIILFVREYTLIFWPLTLIFYGLALFNSSFYTYKEIRYLGLLQVLLGLLAATAPGYGLILWGTGFGILHIIYGSIMHYRYDR